MKSHLPLLLLALAVGCSRPPVHPTPSQVVDSLYRIRAPIQTSGAPTPEQLAMMAPYLSAELQVLLRQAYSAREWARAEHPDEKPPFADGDLFTSLFEGPSRFEVVADSTVGEEHRVTVRFTADGSPSVVWTDQVIVQPSAGYFVVSDVIYGGTWQFAATGALVASLRSAIHELPAP